MANNLSQGGISGHATLTDVMLGAFFGGWVSIVRPWGGSLPKLLILFVCLLLMLYFLDKAFASEFAPLRITLIITCFLFSLFIVVIFGREIKNALILFGIIAIWAGVTCLNKLLAPRLLEAHRILRDRP